MRTWIDKTAYAAIAAAVIVIAWILFSLGGCVSDRGLRDAAVGFGESFGEQISEWKPIDLGAARASGEGAVADSGSPAAPGAMPWEAIGFGSLGALSLWKWWDARRRITNGAAK